MLSTKGHIGNIYINKRICAFISSLCKKSCLTTLTNYAVGNGHFLQLRIQKCLVLWCLWGIRYSNVIEVLFILKKGKSVNINGTNPMHLTQKNKALLSTQLLYLFQIYMPFLLPVTGFLNQNRLEKGNYKERRMKIL